VAFGKNTNRFSAPRERAPGTRLTGITAEVDRQNRDNAYNAAQQNQTGIANLNSITVDGVVNQVNALTGKVVLVPGSNVTITENATEKTLTISSTAGLLTVTDGMTTVTDVSTITITGATITDLGGGNAEITITSGGSLEVTDGTNSVMSVTEIEVAGGLVGAGGTGIAKVTFPIPATTLPTASSANRGFLYLLEGSLTTYDAMILADGAVHYWPLDETVGSSTVSDAVGGLTGTVHSGVTLGATGTVADGETAATFNGSTGWIEFSSPASPTSGPFTYECWDHFKADGNFDILFQNGNASTNGWIIYFDPSNGLNINALSGHAAASPAVSAGWHHCAMTYDGTTFTGYIDGVSVVTLTAAYTTVSSNGNIGNYDGGVLFARATQQKVALFSSALSAATILKHYDAGATGGIAVNDHIFACLADSGGMYSYKQLDN
jgi:Concanavalin A-like lectin/glucanases superfamily